MIHRFCYCDFAFPGVNTLFEVYQTLARIMICPHHIPLLEVFSSVTQLRFAGESKYPLRKMLSLAWEGITSFSARPLRFIFIAGATVSLLSFIAAAAAVIASFSGSTIAGWASIMVMIAFLGGIQLLSIGLIGEYIGKIYIEIKDRPRYFIDIRTDTEETQR